MQLSGSDFVLANDLADIDGDNHKGLLISSKGIIDRPATKQDIAKSIVNHVTNCIGRD
jgi:phosphopantothenate-cysteine ligase